MDAAIVGLVGLGGLYAIAKEIHDNTSLLSEGLKQLGFQQKNSHV